MNRTIANIIHIDLLRQVTHLYCRSNFLKTSVSYWLNNMYVWNLQHPHVFFVVPISLVAANKETYSFCLVMNGHSLM